MTETQISWNKLRVTMQRYLNNLIEVNIWIQATNFDAISLSDLQYLCTHFCVAFWFTDLDSTGFADLTSYQGVNRCEQASKSGFLADKSADRRKQLKMPANIFRSTLHKFWKFRLFMKGDCKWIYYDLRDPEFKTILNAHINAK